MRTLENRFSWSFSAAQDFESCPRKRYWSKYEAWGGWEAAAPPVRKKAWQLAKMTNLNALQGTAGERAAVWMLREAQQGRSPTPDQAYEQIARPFLNQSWKESKTGAWKNDPKRCCCLIEHYYGLLAPDTEKERTDALIALTKTCLLNFAGQVLPQLAGVAPDHEIPVAAPGSGGPESLTIEDVLIYAIPDYAYRSGDLLVIHDWKCGKIKPSHHRQLAVYALWAHRKHDTPPDHIRCWLEYLALGQTEPVLVDQNTLDDILEHIASSVADMTSYLINEDRARNQPVPREEWDLAADPELCNRCPFLELCRPELDA